jgi:hypothetical protein
MTDGLERLKMLINSSTPIVVMETAEETHAVSMVRAACAELKMATFEWTIADGLVRSGNEGAGEAQKVSVEARVDNITTWTGGRKQTQSRTVLSPGSGEGERLAGAILSSLGAGARQSRQSTTRASRRRHWPTWNR